MFSAGHVIGNYRVLQKIGTGGMGAVYLAEHPLIGKRIALKVIHRELANNKEVVQRFFQEARAVNKIGNEHIVEVHDFGVTPEGDHFYIMEYIDGRTLASVLTRERAVPIMRALHIGAQIANALGAAHSCGIIHRDLKPDNIMLVQRLGDPDFVKVLDFGLAKMFQAGGAAAVQTAIGVLLGTPQYMSPEACESKRDVDHRTDIYALGVLLFQMMTGVLPFDGDTMGEVLVKQVTQLPPAPRGLNPTIPPSVEQILLRCLAKAPDARFPTMNALRDALLDPEAYLSASPPIAAARSVAPGQAPADARQVMAAAEARTRMMKEQSAAGVAVPAGSPSAQRTIVYDGAAPIVAPRPPGMPLPAEPKLNTMRIATPAGYSSAAPKRVWPIVLAVGVVLGIGGGVMAVMRFGKGRATETSEAATSQTGSGSGSGAQTATGAQAGTGAQAATGAQAGSAQAGPAQTGSAGTGATGAGATGAAPAAGFVRLSLDSNPTGATVYGPDGAELGKAPISIDWKPSPDPVKLVFKLRGYRDKPVDVTVTKNTFMQAELSKIRAATPQGTQGQKGQPDEPPKEVNGMTGRDGLERPD
ncbi:MAG: protein kinase [Kofleriaceae bacterium]|nr:protein kinase [Kofleriaceae bacterium]